MSEISHQQAIQLIHRRLDELLNERQLLSLEEHLRSCDECSSYASEMELLPLHLRHEFHTRWDKKPGPSQQVVEQVMTKTRNIPMTNRVSSGVKLLAGAMALIILGVAVNFVVSQLQSTSAVTNATRTVDTSTLPQERLLAFASDQNGNFDIYTMHADGTGLTNLTNDPANDTNPIWSPDGKHIAFESDRDGFKQIYIMEADGSDVIQITNDEADHTLPRHYHGRFEPWSPDGSRLIIVQKEVGGATGTLYTIDIKGEKKITLASEKILPSDVSWSPNGMYIAYILNASPNFVPDMYVLDSDGSNLRELKKLLPEGEVPFFTPYFWSTNRQSIVFTSFENDPLRETIYELDLQTNTFINKTEAKPQVEDWTDKISLIVDVNKEGMPYVWEHSDGTSNTFEASKAWGESCTLAFTPSPRHNFAFGVYCPDTKFNLYWANSDGSTIEQLLTLPIDVKTGGVGEIAWSPDDQYIAFNLESDSKTDMYLLNVGEALANPSPQPLQIPVSHDEGYSVPSWQPVTEENITKEIPTPQSTSTSSSGGLIAFASEQNGNSDIYIMHTDGSESINLTNHPADDASPVWSPDGARIAFISNRDNNDNIYVMNADGSGLLRLTDNPAPDRTPLWSPDGTKIAYTSGDSSKEATNIYVVDSNGQNRRRITDNAPHTMVWPAIWSQDNQFIFFDLGQQIVKINVNDGNIKPVTPQGDIPYQFALSKDGSNLQYLVDCNQNSYDFCNRVKIINSDGTNEQVLDTMKIPEVCPVKQTSTWMGSYTKWSPDQTKILFAFTCEENGWLYIANADGSDFKPLTNYPILGNGPQNEVVTFDWSSDNQFVVFMSALDSPESESLYILNVNETLQNADLRPTRITTLISQVLSPSWQPVKVQQVDEISPELKIDPQSCKPALELNSPLLPPSELYGYDLVQGTSFADGDFSYEFWLYCDPSLRPEDNEHFSGIAGLGVYGAWKYTGPQVEGRNQYYFEFEPTVPLGTTSSNGPFYKASGAGSYGIGLPEQTIKKHVQQRDPIQFRILVDSPVGQNGSTLSFNLDPTERGYKISDLHAAALDHPYQGLIAFSSGQNGNTDIYMIRADGSELTNLTNDSTNDYSPLWSPDGKKIAFISERTGNPDIFVMNPDGGDLTQLTDNRGYDGFFSWSPDGAKIAYLSSSGNDPNISQLTVMNADGGQKTTLTEQGSYVILGWSPNAQKIIYQKQNLETGPQDNELHIVDIQGTDEYQWRAIVDEIKWVDEEHFFGFGFSGQSDETPRWLLYRFSTNGDLPNEIASHGSPIVEILKDAHVVEGGTILAWYTLAGNPTPYKNWNFSEVCGQGADQFIPQTSYIAAPNGNRALIVIPCSNSGTTRLYVDPIDGSAIRKLTDFTVQGTGTIQDWKWSSDGKYGIMIISSSDYTKADLYLFDIDKMLENPSIQPIRLTTDEAIKYDAAWQPTP